MGKPRTPNQNGKRKNTESIKIIFKEYMDTIKGPNYRLIGVPEENQDAEQLFEEIMM